MSEQDHHWQQSVIEKLAYSSLDEQRKTRRWGILFKTLTFGYLFIVLFLVMGWLGGNDAGVMSGKFTALVELDGEIAAKNQASADNLNASLQAAFKDKGTQGVVLRINSPGGSPVQSGLVNDEIRRLRSLYPQIPLYVVVEDVCASGGYYIAAAADKIFVNKASIVGSIGVLMDGYGFTGTMEKLGVERRLLTAGENKAIMDPFSARNPKHEAFTKGLLGEIHQQFIDVVKEGRGKRLKESPEIFSGLFWSGQKSIELGLADEIGSLESVARDVIKAENIVDFTAHDGLADRLAKRFGAGVASALPPLSSFMGGGFTLK
jgi:protease IV